MEITDVLLYGGPKVSTVLQTWPRPPTESTVWKLCESVRFEVLRAASRKMAVFKTAAPQKPGRQPPPYTGQSPDSYQRGRRNFEILTA
jgi:hypothetical protein